MVSSNGEPVTHQVEQDPLFLLTLSAKVILTIDVNCPIYNFAV